MSSLWVENRDKKDEEKTLKYGPLRWELKAQYMGKINKNNAIIDVLGGWSVDMERSLRVLLGSRCREILWLMQRSVISSTPHVGRENQCRTNCIGGFRKSAVAIEGQLKGHTSRHINQLNPEVCIAGISKDSKKTIRNVKVRKKKYFGVPWQLVAA